MSVRWLRVGVKSRSKKWKEWGKQTRRIYYEGVCWTDVGSSDTLPRVTDRIMHRYFRSIEDRRDAGIGLNRSGKRLASRFSSKNLIVTYSYTGIGWDDIRVGTYRCSRPFMETVTTHLLRSNRTERTTDSTYFRENVKRNEWTFVKGTRVGIAWKGCTTTCLNSVGFVENG